MSDGEEVYSPETGELLGWAYQADDGGHVLIDENDEIIAATDAQGNAADPAGYTLDGDDDLADVDDLRAEIAEMQEWRENFNPNAAGELGAEYSDQLGDEAWALDVGRQLRNLEESLGRALTQTEMHSILSETRGDYEAGVGSDIGPALDRASGLVPFSPGQDFGESEHEHADARRQFMSQLVADGERTERGEMPGDPPPRHADYYDTNTNVGDRGHSARVAAAMDAVNGYDDVADRTYDSSQPTIEED
jgi:hypothetical protein